MRLLLSWVCRGGSGRAFGGWRSCVWEAWLVGGGCECECKCEGAVIRVVEGLR